MSLSPADRAWIRKQLAKLREDIRVDHQRVLNDVLGEEAALVAFQVMTAKHENPPSA